MSPRRMDGFARPAPVRPQTAPLPPQPVVGPAPRMAPVPAPRRPLAAAPMQAAPAPVQPARPAAAPKKGGGWKVALQFIVGLIVIAAVAGTIVWLYVKYYAQ